MILGVDCGIAKCGWAIIDPRAVVVDLGVIVTEKDAAIAKSIDRARRGDVVLAQLRALAVRHRITAIAAESMLLFGNVAAAWSQLLCWGLLVALARELGVPIVEVTAKDWQHDVVRGVKKIKYAAVFKKLKAFVGPARVDAITPPTLQEHAVDAAGIAFYARLRKTTAVAKPIADRDVKPDNVIATANTNIVLPTERDAGPFPIEPIRAIWTWVERAAFALREQGAITSTPNELRAELDAQESAGAERIAHPELARALRVMAALENMHVDDWLVQRAAEVLMPRRKPPPVVDMQMRLKGVQCQRLVAQVIRCGDGKTATAKHRVTIQTLRGDVASAEHPRLHHALDGAIRMAGARTGSTEED